MAYCDNVQALCDTLGLQNPIREEDLTIDKMTFVTSETTHDVSATDLNRGGRLFLQFHADEATGIQLRPLRAEAQQFFTPALWDDCTPKNRSLIWGIQNADLILITRKQPSA